MLFKVALVATILAAGVIAHKKCSIYRPTVEEVQKSFSNLLGNVDFDSYAQASLELKKVLSWLDFNTDFVKIVHKTYKDLRIEILTNPRKCSEDIKRLTEKAAQFVEKAEWFFNAQKGLENFKTDQCKKDDPFYAEFYFFYSDFVKSAMRTVTDAEFALQYHGESSAIAFTAFVMATDKIIQRAISLE